MTWWRQMNDDFNRFLGGRETVPGGGDRPQDRIERPGEAENIVWQTRAAPPTAYEDALAEALTACFETGIAEIGPLVRRLNEIGVRAPDGDEWTEQSFEHVMGELGA